MAGHKRNEICCGEAQPQRTPSSRGTSTTNPGVGWAQPQRTLVVAWQNHNICARTYLRAQPHVRPAANLQPGFRQGTCRASAEHANEGTASAELYVEPCPNRRSKSEKKTLRLKVVLHIASLSGRVGSKCQEDDAVLLRAQETPARVDHRVLMFNRR